MPEKKVKEEVAKVTTEVEANPELSQEQALNILIQSVKLATKRGAFELEETELILKSIKVFLPKQ